MKRRTFITSVVAVAAASVLPVPKLTPGVAKTMIPWRITATEIHISRRLAKSMRLSIMLNKGRIRKMLEENFFDETP